MVCDPSHPMVQVSNNGNLNHMNDVSDATVAAAAVLDRLDRAMDVVDKGLRGIGIERILSRPQVERTISTLSCADAESVAALISEVSGQCWDSCVALTQESPPSLDSSMRFAHAREAITQCYAVLLVKMREHYPQTEGQSAAPYAVALLRRTHAVARTWIASGTVMWGADRDTENMLHMIARDFLTSAELRYIGILPALTACQSMSSVLNVWEALTQENKVFDPCLTIKI